MNHLLTYLLKPASAEQAQIALCLLRVGTGILTIGHGIPKIMGGVPVWSSIGTMTGYLGIHFLPTMWGFLGACTEFFGGIALVLGLGTKIASLCLIFMMLVATAMHISVGDPFRVYSFPLSLIVVFLTLLIGSDKYSLDYYLFFRK
jgi:putative oxidoreductase